LNNSVAAFPLWLVRHSAPIERIINARRCYGQIDIEIDEIAIAKTIETVDKVIPRCATVISSPSDRCMRLATALCAAQEGRLLRIDERLRELNFGRWEGIPWDQIDRTELDQWAAAPLDFDAHGGESVRTLAERVVAALRESAIDAQPTAWITHNGPVRIVQTVFQGLNLDSVATQSGIEFGEAIYLKP
jgi:alpha-ribazole phosphatase